MTDLVFLPIRELSELVRTRQVSAVELAETFLDRLDTIGPRFNATVTVTRDHALIEARRADEEIGRGEYRGPLHGIPYGAKDLLATKGFPTTWGAAPLREQVFDYDATVVRKLRDAGAVPMAKLAMVELAGGMGYETPNASLTGPGLNPWDSSRWAGGSSSGSGAAVAAGLAPFAIGSETWGSILIPGAFCGVAGLRPTYGRVSRHGAMALSWSLDKLGPLCLTADDCGMVLDAIAGPDPLDATATSRPYRYDRSGPPDGRMKLAVPEDAAAGCDDAARLNFDAALAVLESVADITEVTLPEYPYEAVAYTIISAEAASALEDFVDEGKGSELADRSGLFGPYAGRAVLATEYLKALRLRGLIARDIDAVLAPYDAMVAPVSSAAPSADAVFDKSRPGRSSTGAPVSAIGNVAGLPAITVPDGFTEGGLPTGIQFMGRAYDENSVLAAARVYQSLTTWHERHPRVDEVR